MNTLLRIRIQVAVQQAKEVAKLRGQLGELQKVAKNTERVGASAGAGLGGVRTELAAATKQAQAFQTQLERVNKALNAKSDYKAINKNLQSFSAPASSTKAHQAELAAARAAANEQVKIAAKAAKDAANAREAALKAKIPNLQQINKNLANYGKTETLRSHQQELQAEAKKLAEIHKLNRTVMAKMEREFAAIKKREVAEAAAAAKQQAKLARQQATEDAKVVAQIEKLNRTAIATMEREFVQAEKRKAQAQINEARAAVAEIRRISQLSAAGIMPKGDAKARITSIGVSSKDVAVTTAAALALKKLEAAEKKVAAAASQTTRVMEKQQVSLLNVGRQVQWTGRQLEYNFTIPLVRAASAVFDLQVESNKAMTRIVKVYGDGSDAAHELSVRHMELGVAMQSVNRGAMSEGEQMAYDLGRAWRLMSDTFGSSVNQVSEVGALWAQAGFTGAALVKQVQLTMETAMVGDMSDSTEAVEGLIKVQSAFGFSTDQMRGRIAQLNAVENATAATTQQLIAAIARSGSVAASSGVTYEELVAQIAALVPAYGTAETAGNALKTMYSRILVPAKDASDIIELMGINVGESGWESVGATGRLKILADTMEGLSDQQKAMVATHIAGRYQLNKFDGLVKELANNGSKYYEVLKLIEDGQLDGSQAIRIYRKEIQEHLASSSQTIEIMKTRILNAGSEILIQLMPAILWVVSSISALVAKFSELDPKIQKLVVMGLVFLAAVGPVMRLVGAGIQLVGVFQAIGKAAIWVGQALVSAGGFALANPYVLLAAALIAAGVAAYVFRDRIVDGLQSAWNYIRPWIEAVGRGMHAVWNALPAAVRNALTAVLRIVVAAGMAIYRALQRINPFARHSPSLVDNVVAGVDLIARKYASLSNIGSVFRKATADMEAFGAATAGILSSGKETKRNEIRADVATAAPSAGPALENLFSSQDALEGALKDVGAEVAAQKAIVARLQKAYDDLGRSIDVANDALDAAKDRASAIKTEMDAAQAALDRYSKAQITGMGAASDAAFANEMEVKRLKLAIMDLEDAGGSVEEIQQKMADLAGEIETLQGLESSLRGAGAGSEITGPIMDRIAALQDEAQVVRDQAAPYNDLEAQLKALERQGERMDLENSLKFDPLTRQIEKMTNAVEELPFDVIVAGITDSKNKVDQLTAAYDDANKEVAIHEGIVKDLETARKILSDEMEGEQAKLAELEAAYDALNDQLSAVTSMLNDIASAAKAATDALDDAADTDLTALEQAWQDAADGGDFSIDPTLGAGMDAGTIEEWIDEFMKEFGNADFKFEVPFFDDIKKAWYSFVDWWGANVAPNWKVILLAGLGGLGTVLFGAIVPALAVAWYFRDELLVAWHAVVDGFIWLKDKAIAIWTSFTRWTGWNWLKDNFLDLYGSIKTFVDRTIDKVKEMWDDISPRLAKFKELGEPLARLFEVITTGLSTAWVVAQPIIALFIANLVLLAGYVMGTFSRIVEFVTPIWTLLWDLIIAVAGPAIDLIRGLITFFLATITGDFGGMKDGVIIIVTALWEAMKNIYWVGVGAVWGFLKWLWDKISGFYEAVVKFFVGLGKSFYDDFIAPIGRFIGGVITRFETFKTDASIALGNVGQFLWDGVSAGFTLLTGNVGGVVDGIVGFFTGLPDRIAGANYWIFLAAYNIGMEIRKGLLAALDAMGFRADFAGAIGDALRNVINPIITQFQNGINSALSPLKAVLGQVGITVPTVDLSWLKFHDGGMVPGPRGAEIPAILQAGEFVLSRNAVESLTRSGGSSSSQPLSSQTSNSKVMVFNGDLSFPNIQNGDDADKFLRNLEALAVS